MARTEPNQPLRAGLATVLTPIDVPVESKNFPIDTKTTKRYILISSQTKQRFAVSKDCYDYLCSVQIDVNSIFSNGVANADSNDELEGQIVNQIEGGTLEVEGFRINEIRFIQSIDLDVSTPTMTILRRVITYQFWLGQITQDDIAGFPYTFPFALS